jgi:hypothetical protein
LFEAEAAGRHAVHGVGEVGGQRGVERHVVAHHADEGRDVVVERREHRLVAVGPRHAMFFSVTL